MARKSRKQGNSNSQNNNTENDTRDPPTEIDKLIAGALIWAKRGVPVFPCKRDKKPCTKNGFYDAVTDPDEVRKLFLYHKKNCVMIGAATGALSGHDVLDIDPKNNGHEWELIDQLSQTTRIHMTPSGGWHYWFRHADGLRNSAGRIAVGIDVRADGGYVIVPPSPGYRVLNAKTDIDAVGDEAWQEWLLPLARKANAKLADLKEHEIPGHYKLTPVPFAKCEEKLKWALQTVRESEPGKRHDTLRKMAFLIGGHMEWMPEWTEEGLWEKFSDAVSEVIDGPVGDREWSAFHWGLNKGRDLTIGFNSFFTPNRSQPDKESREYLPPEQQMPGKLFEGTIDSNDPRSILDYFNRQYYVVDYHGKMRVLSEIYIPGKKGKPGKTRTNIMDFDNFRNKFSNRLSISMEQGKAKEIGWADLWFNDPNRKTYQQAFFDPSEPACTHSNQMIYQLWRGFAVKPAKGDWSLLQAHILNVICSGNKEHYEYLIQWVAFMFQFLGIQSGVDVVLRSENEGTGKGIFTDELLLIIGRHGVECPSGNMLNHVNRL